jgi:VWFA-related protein
MRRAVAVFAGVLSLAADVPPSSPPERAPLRLRVGVDLVQFDAVVTDSKGRHVTDLGIADFELLQDGARQVITHCEYVNVAAGGTDTAAVSGSSPAPAVSAPGALPQAHEVRRSIAFLVSWPRDDQFTHIRDSLRAFVDKEMGPGDVVAIVPMRPSMSMPGLLQQFTADKRVLRATIDAIRPIATTPLERGQSPTWLSVRTPRSELAMALDRAGFAPPETDVRDDEQLGAHYFGMISALVRLMAELPGRKSLVFVSNGIYVPAGQVGPAEIPELGFVDPGERGGQSFGFRNYDAQLRRLTDSAYRAGVVVYGADLGGVRSRSPQAADENPARSRNPLATLPAVRARIRQGVAASIATMIPRDMSAATGGFFIAHNDLAGGIQDAMQDQRGYYLVGYSPPAAGFKPSRRAADFHKVELRVKRPGLRVRTRGGFFGTPDPDVRAPRRGDALDTALVSPVGSPQLGLRLTAAPFHDPSRGYVLRSLVHLDGNRVSFTPEPDGGQRARVEVLAVAFDDETGAVQHLKRDVSVRVPPEARDALDGSGLFLDFSLAVSEPGAYRLRVAVRDAVSGRIDKADAFAQVPDLVGGDLAVSGLVVSSQADLVGSGGEAPDSGGLVMDAGVTPARRAFRAGATLSYAFAAHNVREVAGEAPLAGRMRIRGAGAEAVIEHAIAIPSRDPAPASTARRARTVPVSGRAALPDDLAPGAYTLEVIVESSRAGRTPAASQSIDFEVVP